MGYFSFISLNNPILYKKTIRAKDNIILRIIDKMDVVF